MGPVAVSALLFLIAVSPLMRGGNRHVAMIVLEGAALAFLAAVSVRAWASPSRLSSREWLIAFILLSPLWLALVYLVPLPASLWDMAPGRALYTELMTAASVPASGWQPLSLVPDATKASLFAALPLVAAFLAAYLARLSQLKVMLAVLIGLAFFEVIVGFLQVFGGSGSSLFFGAPSARPFGTFANPNHFANYVALALAAYVWLGWSNLSAPANPMRFGGDRLSRGRVVALWIAGAVFLTAGVVITRSRGAAVLGLGAAVAALLLALTAGSQRSWRTNMIMVAGGLGAVIALVGLDLVVARFGAAEVARAASSRSLLASTSFDGAAHFWPWGSGWGTYAAVYPQFQPAAIAGIADYAHQDYVQMLFEGGIFAVLLMAAFGWLAATRAVTLIRAGIRRRRLRREEMAAAICGLGLLGFLLHSFVEFNMHIPANAIAAALLAGVYLRPLDREPREAREEERSDD